jgi:hypothetical protein
MNALNSDYYEKRLTKLNEMSLDFVHVLLIYAENEILTDDCIKRPAYEVLKKWRIPPYHTSASK